jgi:hypothetical protein
MTETSESAWGIGNERGVCGTDQGRLNPIHTSAVLNGAMTAALRWSNAIGFKCAHELSR